jgi:hypothetical protein
MFMKASNKHFKLIHWDVAPLKIMGALTILNLLAFPATCRGQLK